MNTHYPLRHSLIAEAGARHFRERGAVLVIGLLLLLLMTIIAVTAIRGSGLEERMTGNVQDNNIAFQAAEAGLRAAEADLQAFGFDPAATPPGNNGYYAGQTTALRWNTIDWADAAAVRSYTGFAGAPAGLNGATANYYFEKLAVSQQVATGETIVVASTSNKTLSFTFFRITSRGRGISGNSVVILESMYKAVN